jgi:hypothetical protein
MRWLLRVLFAATVVAATAGVGAPTGSASSGSSPLTSSASTTGGGWIIVPGGKATVGFVAGLASDGSVRGHLQYEDHGGGFSLKSTEIVAFFSAGCQATFSGFGDAGLVEFTVEVTDGGEPGISDTFSIQAAGAGVPLGTYFQSGILGGGDIQVHGPTCP